MTMKRYAIGISDDGNKLEIHINQEVLLLPFNIGADFLKAVTKSLQIISSEATEKTEEMERFDNFATAFKLMEDE